jgi:hypothetical protein
VVRDTGSTRLTYKVWFMVKSTSRFTIGLSLILGL